MTEPEPTDTPVAATEEPVDPAADANTGEAAPAGASSEAQPPKRQKSTVQFPYNDLTSTEELTAVLFNSRGGECDVPQLAGSMKQQPTSGAFRLKLSAAAMYGFVKLEGGTISIQPLGHAVLNPEQRDAARVAAFLNVELYEKLHREFRLGTLPDDQGVEAKMILLGVTPNQAARARQIFVRAAEQAGFFAAGRNRLVKPTTGTLGNGSQGRPDDPEGRDGKREQHDGGVSVMSDPMLTGLFERLLPHEGQPFPARERQRLLRSFAITLDAIYGEPDDGELDVAAFNTLFKPNRESVA